MRRPNIATHALPLLATLLLVVHATAGTPAPSTQFRYQRTLTSPSEQEEIAAATLDPETWACLRPTAPDLRITAPDDTLVPHLLRRATAERIRRVRSACNSSVEALRELPDNRIEIDLKIPDTQPTADTLIITTPLKDFERRITIDGRNPDGTTERLVTDALIYDYSRFIDLRHLTVEIPRNDFHQ